jgi:hypothetical protein
MRDMPVKITDRIAPTATKKRCGLCYVIFLSFLLLTKSASAGIYSDTTAIEDGLTTAQYLSYATELCGQFDFDGCLNACKKVLAVEPGNRQALIIISHAYYMQNKLDSGIIYTKRALTLDTAVTAGLYNELSDAYRGLNDWTNAKFIDQKLLNSQPDNQIARQNLAYDEKRISEQRSSHFKTSIFFLLILLVLCISCFPLGAASFNRTDFSRTGGFAEAFLISVFVGALLYFIFFFLAPYARSTNLKIPTNQLLELVRYYSFEHDGMEGTLLYMLISGGVFLTFILSRIFMQIRDVKIRLLVSFPMLGIGYLFLNQVGFFPPGASPAPGIIGWLCITLSIIIPLYIAVLYSWKITVGVCALCLLPVSFIAISPMSLFDAGFILSPALRMHYGFKLSEIYFQYDLLLSLVALLGIKLNMTYSLIQYVAQFSIYSLFLGLLFFTRNLFFNKNLVVLFLIFVVILRFYANGADLMSTQQITPLRLDLWLILLVLVYWKTPYHWSVGLVSGLMIVLHRNFGYIYLAAYLQLLLVLFIADVWGKGKPVSLQVTVRQTLKNHFELVWKNILLIATGILLSRFLFGGFTPEAMKVYGALGLGMIPISAISFYWYVPVVLGLLSTLLLTNRQNLTSRYFVAGIFIVLLSIGNSLYFLGRSHENNILNISAVLALALYLLFDLMIFTARKGAVTNNLKYAFKGNAFYLLPFIAIFFATWYYGTRTENKIKKQCANLLKGQLIRPQSEWSDSASIRVLTHNTSKVYFLDYGNDFQDYYFGNYVPVGYLNPSGSWVIKKDLAVFLQKLLDDHYCVVDYCPFTLPQVLPLLSCNRLEAAKGYVVAAKDSNEFFFRQDSTDAIHIAIEKSLYNLGLDCRPLKLASEFVIQVLVRPDSTQVPFATIMDNMHSTIGSRGLSMAQVDTMNNTFVFMYGDNANWISSGSFKLNPGKWSIITVAFDNKSLKLFVNGKNLHTIASAPILRNSVLPLIIGNRALRDRPFRGSIREVKITNDRSDYGTDLPGILERRMP